MTIIRYNQVNDVDCFYFSKDTLGGVSGNESIIFQEFSVDKFHGIRVLCKPWHIVATRSTKAFYIGIIYDQSLVSCCIFISYS